MLFPCSQMRLHVTNHIYSKWKEIPVSTSTILVDGPWWVSTVTALVLATNFLSWFWEALSPCPSGQWPANMEPVAEQDLFQMWQSLRHKPSLRNQYPMVLKALDYFLFATIGCILYFHRSLGVYRTLLAWMADLGLAPGGTRLIHSFSCILPSELFIFQLSEKLKRRGWSCYNPVRHF